MNRGAFSWPLAALYVALAPVQATAAAPEAARSFDVPQASLSSALRQLAREGGVELLFSEALVRNLKGGPVRGRLTVPQALGKLLAGSGVGYRATPDGAFVLFLLPRQAAEETNDGAVSEILVIGRRTQNADIRRTENDIQAYKVSTRDELDLSQRNTVDQFMRARVPANAQVRPPNLNVVRAPASTRSEIDLRGIGSLRTLVLVDGRRIPTLPSGVSDFDQGDLNGVPLGAIERIETLTSTAGGIFGPSAIGGVVNVVLRRDYRGADLSVISGVTSRGDAANVRLEARLGFTPDHGRTDVMMFGSYAETEPFYAGDRDFGERSRRRQFANNPDGYLDQLPTGEGVAVYAAQPLVLDPRFGGNALGSTHTFLPLDFVGTDAERAAYLAANSGGVLVSLPPDGSGQRKSLMSNPKIASALLNIRHRLSDRLEVFADGFYWVNEGTARGGGEPFAVATLANAPSNPFTRPVFFRFPTEAFGDRVHNRVQVSRVTGGVIARLPHNWQASADYAWGRSVLDSGGAGVSANRDFFSSLATGLPGSGGQPALAPLGSYEDLRAAVAAYGAPSGFGATLSNHFSDASVRAAGPIASLPGGPLTATLLAEARREHVPASELRLALPGLNQTITTPQRTQKVLSAYGELRAPIGRPVGSGSIFQGLELQLAVRHDSTRTRFPENVLLLAPSNDRLVTVRREATAFTGGLSLRPRPWLLLRGSVATGELPPLISELQSSEQIVSPPNTRIRDPRRGGQFVGQEGPAVQISGGSHEIRQEKGRTVAIGFVLNPTREHGPRMSVDYSRINTRDEITGFPLTASELLAAEIQYPDRVIRAPLTEADVAQGFTAGPVIVLDTRAMNAARTVVEAVDFELDWLLPTTRAGDVRLYGSATWQPTFRRRAADGEPWVDRIGAYDGLLEWRGNAGVQLRRGPLTVDLNLQYFDSYRVTYAAHDAAALQLNERKLLYQGAPRIPSQVYVDLVARRVFQIDGPGPLDLIEVRFGVQNLFDNSPPIDAEPGDVGYSLYGDPRRRRFELLLSAKF